MHIFHQSPFCCTPMKTVDKLKSQLGNATKPLRFRGIQSIKVRSFKNILPTAAIGWWHHFVKVESRVDDGADFNITSLPFSMDNFTFTFCQLVISPNLCPVFCYLFSDWKFYLSVTFYFLSFCQLVINVMDISHTPPSSVNLETQFFSVNICVKLSEEEKTFIGAFASELLSLILNW